MEKIKRIKHLLKKNGIDGYLVPKNDEFLVNMFQKIKTT